MLQALHFIFCLSGRGVIVQHQHYTLLCHMKGLHYHFSIQYFFLPSLSGSASLLFDLFFLYTSSHTLPPRQACLQYSKDILSRLDHNRRSFEPQILLPDLIWRSPIMSNFHPVSGTDHFVNHFFSSISPGGVIFH